MQQIMPIINDKVLKCQTELWADRKNSGTDPSHQCMEAKLLLSRGKRYGEKCVGFQSGQERLSEFAGILHLTEQLHSYIKICETMFRILIFSNIYLFKYIKYQYIDNIYYIEQSFEMYGLIRNDRSEKNEGFYPYLLLSLLTDWIRSNNKIVLN